MANYKEAAENVRALTRMLKGVMQVGEILDAVGNLDQLEREAKMRADNAKKAADQAESLAKEAKTELAKAKDKIKAAEDKAADTVGDAIAQANKITGDAKAEADAMREQGQSACLAANAKLGEINAAIADAQIKRDAAETECAAVEAKLAKIKAQVAKVLEA